MSSLGACAFGDRNVILDYPPQTENASHALLQTSDKPVAAGNRQKLVISLFEDQREDKVAIGEVRNGLGMKTASVITQSNVPAWIREATRHEFQTAGFDVFFGENSEVNAPVLDGQIITVYCGAFFTYEGEVSLGATLKHDGINLLENRYYGKGSVGTNWGATSKGYGQSLARALQDALGSLVGDVQQAFIAKPVMANVTATSTSIVSSSTSISGLNSQTVLPELSARTNSITGRYISEITTNYQWAFNNKKHRRLEIRFEENGNDVTGINSSANLKITGTREGDKITFFLWPSDVANGEITGEWAVNADGTKMKGTWNLPGYGNGSWNLSKIK
jgi:hypothetical protein